MKRTTEHSRLENSSIQMLRMENKLKSEEVDQLRKTNPEFNQMCMIFSGYLKDIENKITSVMRYKKEERENAKLQYEANETKMTDAFCALKRVEEKIHKLDYAKFCTDLKFVLQEASKKDELKAEYDELVKTLATHGITVEKIEKIQKAKASDALLSTESQERPTESPFSAPSPKRAFHKGETIFNPQTEKRTESFSKFSAPNDFEASTAKSDFSEAQKSITKKNGNSFLAPVKMGFSSANNFGSLPQSNLKERFPMKSNESSMIAAEGKFNPLAQPDFSKSHKTESNPFLLSTKFQNSGSSSSVFGSSSLSTVPVSGTDTNFIEKSSKATSMFSLPSVISKGSVSVDSQTSTDKLANNQCEAYTSSAFVLANSEVPKKGNNELKPTPFMDSSQNPLKSLESTGKSMDNLSHGNERVATDTVTGNSDSTSFGIAFIGKRHRENAEGSKGEILQESSTFPQSSSIFGDKKGVETGPFAVSNNTGNKSNILAVGNPFDSKPNPFSANSSTESNANPFAVSGTDEGKPSPFTATSTTEIKSIPFAMSSNTENQSNPFTLNSSEGKPNPFTLSNETEIKTNLMGISHNTESKSSMNVLSNSSSNKDQSLTVGSVSQNKPNPFTPRNNTESKTGPFVVSNFSVDKTGPFVVNKNTDINSNPFGVSSSSESKPKSFTTSSNESSSCPLALNNSSSSQSDQAKLGNITENKTTLFAVNKNDESKSNLFTFSSPRVSKSNVTTTSIGSGDNSNPFTLNRNSENKPKQTNTTGNSESKSNLFAASNSTGIKSNPFSATSNTENDPFSLNSSTKGRSNPVAINRTENKSSPFVTSSSTESKSNPFYTINSTKGNSNFFSANNSDTSQSNSATLSTSENKPASLIMGGTTESKSDFTATNNTESISNPFMLNSKSESKSEPLAMGGTTGNKVSPLSANNTTDIKSNPFSVTNNVENNPFSLNRSSKSQPNPAILSSTENKLEPLTVNTAGEKKANTSESTKNAFSLAQSTSPGNEVFKNSPFLSATTSTSSTANGGAFCQGSPLNTISKKESSNEEIAKQPSNEGNPFAFSMVAGVPNPFAPQKKDASEEKKCENPFLRSLPKIPEAKTLSPFQMNTTYSFSTPPTDSAQNKESPDAASTLGRPDASTPSTLISPQATTPEQLQ